MKCWPVFKQDPSIVRFAVTDQQEGGGRAVDLRIRNAGNSDSGDYECRASNAHGTTSLHLRLEVQGKLTATLVCHIRQAKS